MRFLHLSDLHLGKRVCEFSMLDDQRYILEQILSLLDSRPVDAVLLAGDLYDKPVQMRIEAYFPIPTAFSKKKAVEASEGKICPQKKPDADNIAKIICDALNEVAYKDDTQIIELTIVKKYAKEPKVRVTLCAYL